MQYIYLKSYKIFSCETHEMLVDLARNVKRKLLEISSFRREEIEHCPAFLFDSLAANFTLQLKIPRSMIIAICMLSLSEKI